MATTGVLAIFLAGLLASGAPLVLSLATAVGSLVLLRTRSPQRRWKWLYGWVAVVGSLLVELAQIAESVFLVGMLAAVVKHHEHNALDVVIMLAWIVVPPVVGVAPIVLARLVVHRHRPDGEVATPADGG